MDHIKNSIDQSPNYGTFSQRLLAHNIDLIPILLLFYLSTLIPNVTIHYALLYGIYVLYHTVFELSTWKGSPGKRFVKLRVIPNPGLMGPAFSIVIRNLLKGLSLILLFGGFIMIVLHPKKQALHDYITGTVILFGQE